MRKFFLSAFVLSAMLMLASSGFALEKASVRLTDDSRGDGWSSAATCNVIYYNFCTGWLWVWGGWSPNDRVGVCFDSCCPTGQQSTLNTFWEVFRPGALTGYGFTGTIDVFNADANCCPTGAPLASQPFLPLVSGWNSWLFGVNVPAKFIVAWTNGPVPANPLRPATEHPAAGPTGPQACGYCYPNPHLTHAYYWGTPTSPLCPGATFNDGVCNSELYADCSLTCTIVIGVEENSWGSIKNLYR